MLRRIPKVLLLVAFLSAFAVSSAATFIDFPKKVCCFSLQATNCSIDKNGNCHTQQCKPGEPCSHSACGNIFCSF